MGSISLMSSQPPKKRGGGMEEKLVEERRIGGGRKKPQVPVLGLEKDCLPDLFCSPPFSLGQSRVLGN